MCSGVLFCLHHSLLVRPLWWQASINLNIFCFCSRLEVFLFMLFYPKNKEDNLGEQEVRSRMDTFFLWFFACSDPIIEIEYCFNFTCFNVIKTSHSTIQVVRNFFYLFFNQIHAYTIIFLACRRRANRRKGLKVQPFRLACSQIIDFVIILFNLIAKSMIWRALFLVQTSK